MINWQEANSGVLAPTSAPEAASTAHHSRYPPRSPPPPPLAAAAAITACAKDSYQILEELRKVVDNQNQLLFVHSF